MKRILMIIGITILLILTSAVTSYADLSLMVGLIADTTEVKAGDTFTVTLTASCSDGINGVVTTYSYDEDKLEYVSEGVVDTDNYSFGGNKDAKEIFVYCTSTDSIQSANLYSLTFRVKEGVVAGSIAKVSVSQIELDSDAAIDSEHIIEGQEVSVTIVADVTEEGEEQDPPTEGGEEQKPPVVDDGKDETTGGMTVIVGDDKKDNTTADKEIPKAGLNSMLILGIVAIVIIAVVMYRKNQKYRDIR